MTVMKTQATLSRAMKTITLEAVKARPMTDRLLLSGPQHEIIYPITVSDKVVYVCSVKHATSHVTLAVLRE